MPLSRQPGAEIAVSAACWRLCPRIGDGRPNYFILLQWSEDGLASIRDFLFAPYATDGAEIVVLD